MTAKRVLVGGAVIVLATLVAALLMARAQSGASSAAGAPPDPAAIASFSAVKERAASADYQSARWDPIHFKPAIDYAKNEACLVCHKEIVSDKPRDVSPAGVKAADTLAWYQTLGTYSGSQSTFHWRHLKSSFAKKVMNLDCNFCHQGADPREKAPYVTAVNADGSNATAWRDDAPAFTLRKTVNPTETCLRCHGSYPAEVMGLSGAWHEMRDSLENEDTPNGCLSCHADQFRTVRHQVKYLKADAIEQAAKTDSDVCYGCHGGRQWYRISYPYPRHPWPGMTDEMPDWAKDRPTKSDPRFDLSKK